MIHGPYRDGKVHVLTEQCATCVFRRGTFHLAPGRLKQLVKKNLEAGAALTCHETLPYGPYPEAAPAICRGFYDAHRDGVPALQIAKQMGLIEEDSTPS